MCSVDAEDAAFHLDCNTVKSYYSSESLALEIKNKTKREIELLCHGEKTD